jgi:hypothetical protein
MRQCTEKKRKANSQDEPLSVLVSSLKLPTQLHHVIGTALHAWDKNLSEWSLIMSCQCNVRAPERICRNVFVAAQVSHTCHTLRTLLLRRPLYRCSGVV